MYTIDRLKYKKYGFLSGIMSILLIVIGACSDDNSTGTDVWETPGNVVVSTIPERTAIVKNPMMGWVLYAGLGDGLADSYWEDYDNMQSSAGIVRVSDYATTLFIRASWTDFNPEEGKYAWDEDVNTKAAQRFKMLVEGAAERGLKLAFAVIIDSQDKSYDFTPAYVKNGGTLVTTVMSGLADENDRCVFGAYPGKLKDMLGIWVEETDALRPYEQNHMKIEKADMVSREEYSCDFLCDIIHPEGGAEVLATYEDDFYAGTPCVTCNTFGKGKAYYIGTQPEQKFLEELMEKICKDCNIESVYSADEGVELTVRKSDKGRIVFVINHNSKEAEVDFGTDKLKSLIDERKFTGKNTIQPGDVFVTIVEE